MSNPERIQIEWCFRIFKKNGPYNRFDREFMCPTRDDAFARAAEMGFRQRGDDLFSLVKDEEFSGTIYPEGEAFLDLRRKISLMEYGNTNEARETLRAVLFCSDPDMFVNDIYKAFYRLTFFAIFNRRDDAEELWHWANIIHIFVHRLIDMRPDQPKWAETMQTRFNLLKNLLNSLVATTMQDIASHHYTEILDFVRNNGTVTYEEIVDKQAYAPNVTKVFVERLVESRKLEQNGVGASARFG